MQPGIQPIIGAWSVITIVLGMLAFAVIVNWLHERGRRG